MAAENSGRERDLILAPNQFAWIQDETKGNLSVYVGPNKTSLAGTDRPVVNDPETRKYVRVPLEEAIQEFLLAKEGSYIELENPVEKGGLQHPGQGSSNLPTLSSGRKINSHGPATFPLWPGQIARVIDGHRLRSNQFLLIRVYNADAARENWGKSVMVRKRTVEAKPTNDVTQSDPAVSAKDDGASVPPKGTDADVPKTEPVEGGEFPAADLTVGQLLVIKGTEVSFYMPPTGIEVVPDATGVYVRDAVTLERMEMCVLSDESGDKRIAVGPAVIFPEPTESFYEKDGSRKFKLIELNDDMGIYLKVTADYTEADGTLRKAGEELFITGKDQKIYYPREEHTIIKYGEHDRHYGIVITEGEARYVLDKQKGSVDTIKGPRILLPDPRKQVVVRRVLEAKEVELWYPGNVDAAEYNARLREIVRNSRESSRERALSEMEVATAMPPTRHVPLMAAAAANAVVAGGDFQRGKSYTPPRTLTLDTKYEGAVAMNPWSGYAVLLVNKSGGRRVVQGPTLLDYHEVPQVLALSTNNPKNTDSIYRTVYLKVKHNQVSDTVSVVTKDMVEVKIKLSYRVNFEGDQPEKWFSVENYVKFLCDHARSKLRGVAKNVGIEQLNDSAHSIVRDAILGKSEEGKKRPGLAFEENGMRVYDVEVLGVTIGDDTVRQGLVQAQHESVKAAMMIAAKERGLEAARRLAVIERETLQITAETDRQRAELQKTEIERTLTLALAKIASETQAAEQRYQAKLDEQGVIGLIDEATLAREKSRRDQELAFAQKQLDMKLAEISADVEGVVKKAGAIDKHAIAALQAFADKKLAGDLAQSLAPLAILGGGSVADVAKKLLSGTKFAEVVEDLATKTNGAHA